MKSGMLRPRRWPRRWPAGGAGELGPTRTSCAQAGSGRSCHGSATSARPSPNSGCGAASPIPRSTPTCCAARRRGPSTIAHPDNETLIEAEAAPRIDYPRPDGVLTFDRLSSVFISNTNHEENQPPHLQLEDPGAGDHAELGTLPQSRRRAIARPRVYEIVGADEGNRGCRSTRRTACTARPATSRTRPRTSTGSRPRAAAGRTIPAGCEKLQPAPGDHVHIIAYCVQIRMTLADAVK